MSSAPQLTVRQFIKGKRERVYQAWLKPELAVQWFSPQNLTPVSFRTDAKVGGSYIHVMKNAEGQQITTFGEYLELVENEKLVFTWGSEAKGAAGSVVTVELSDQDGGTLVTLTQIKLPEDLVPGHIKGWESALRHMDTFFKGDKT
jgi:uncharacterized protein YndB with AHSA1/START domain